MINIIVKDEQVGLGLANESDNLNSFVLVDANFGKVFLFLCVNSWFFCLGISTFIIWR